MTVDDDPEFASLMREVFAVYRRERLPPTRAAMCKTIEDLQPKPVPPTVKVGPYR